QAPGEFDAAALNWEIFKSIERLKAIFYEEKVDIVHLHGLRFAPAVRIAAAAAGAPLVARFDLDCVRRFSTLERVHKRLERQILAAIPLVVRTQREEEEARRFFALDELFPLKSLEQIADGADDAPLWAGEPRWDAWIERRAAGKKIALLLEPLAASVRRMPDYLAACRSLIDLGEDLFVALFAAPDDAKGGEALSAYFRQTFRPSEGEFFDVLTRPEPLIPHAAAVVSPGRVTEMPIGLAECLAAGLPAVCSDYGIHRQIIAPDANGLLFEAGDFHSLVRGLHRLLNDEALRRRLGERARESVESFRWLAVARQMLEFYRRILSMEG
ncbi:MAG: glycosyltransferase family 4 protein, partial [Candidatus Sumerlaeota bacterium]|nr:glycosyltransferase family 4 protein [Candidatus Sumerlaeota bacterium]